MKKILPLLALLLFIFHPGYAQTYTVTGSVKDTLNMADLYRASVVLISTPDSVIRAYTRTGPDGRFELHAPAKGAYLLRISFPSFADYVDGISITKTATDAGEIPMVSKEHLLKEFVFTKQRSAIKIKGDTTEYMADSFKVKENATVEDLLKRLPGIQVDKDGQITAQGETVQKILVDGEEFFSDDPKVVTQGLQANAVEKVQVYDKKSDQAAFTGIDDGQKTKTINLELKEDKKKGYFGKADLGAGTDSYFQDQAMVNAFKGNRQFSAFAITSNTDKIGLGWQDNDKFGAGNGTTVITDDGGVMTTYSGTSDPDFGGWNGKYNGQGLPRTWTGGAHYADKWNEDKDHLTANYRYGMQDVTLEGNTTTQYVLPGNSGLVSRESKDQYSVSERHSLDVSNEWKIDSSSTLKLTADGGYKQSRTSSGYSTFTNYENDARANYNSRSISSNAYNSYVNADLLYKKKFAKKGRTLSVDVKENYKELKSDGYLKSATTLYTDTAGQTDSTVSLTDQHKTSQTNTLAIAAKATYTEPLSKVAFMEVNYGATVNNSTGVNNSFNRDSTGKYSSIPDDTYSSDFKYNILTNSGGLNFKFVYKKTNFSFGSDISNSSYLQTDLYHGDTSNHYNYLNLFPRASFTYKISKQSSLNFSYQGNTQQPSISQIQPLKQNTDPLNITLGNPSLKQQFNNRVSLSYNDYKVLSGRYMYGNASFTSIADGISTRQTTIGGVNTTQYINVDGNYSGRCYLGMGQRFPKLNLYVGMQGSMNANHVNNIITTIDTATRLATDHKNTNNNNNYYFGPYVNYAKEDKLEFDFQPAITYNDNRSTISTFSNSYWSFDCNSSFTVQLPHKFEFGSNVDIMIREKTEVFTGNNNVVKWDAFVGKKFLKKSQLELKASVLDILDQNIGYNRTANAGIITENNYNTIRRHGMLQLIWNFTHTPAGAPGSTNNAVIISK